MNHFIYGVVKAAKETFSLPPPFVEIGSYIVEGQETLALRPLFEGSDYCGIDSRPGPGVDRIGDVERLDLPDGSAGTLLALNVFEHVRHFWKGFEEIRRVLRPDGVLIVSMPFYFHIHAYPVDYWRCTPEGLKILLDPFPSKIVGTQGLEKRPTNVWGIAFGDDYREVGEADMKTLRAQLAKHAREPMDAWTRTRYGIGRLLCGRRPFEPWLDASRFQCELFCR